MDTAWGVVVAIIATMVMIYAVNTNHIEMNNNMAAAFDTPPPTMKDLFSTAGCLTGFKRHNIHRAIDRAGRVGPLRRNDPGFYIQGWETSLNTLYDEQWLRTPQLFEFYNWQATKLPPGFVSALMCAIAKKCHCAELRHS